MKFIAIIITIITLMVSISVFAQDKAQGNEWDVFLSGDVKVESIESSEGIPGVKLQFVVAATRKKIWRALLDYENFTKIFSGIEKLRVIEENENGALVEFWIDAIIKKIHYVLYRKYSQEAVLLEWNKASGDLKTIQGSWRIEDTSLPNKKLIIYESYVDSGYSVITWGIRQAAKSKARKMAYRLRKWLEQPDKPFVSE